MEGKERNLNYLSIRRNLDGENNWKKFLVLKSENPAEFFGSNYLLFGGGGGRGGELTAFDIRWKLQQNGSTGEKQVEKFVDFRRQKLIFSKFSTLHSKIPQRLFAFRLAFSKNLFSSYFFHFIYSDFFFFFFVRYDVQSTSTWLRPACLYFQTHDSLDYSLWLAWLAWLLAIYYPVSISAPYYLLLLSNYLCS